jgi:UPF0755 protein
MPNKKSKKHYKYSSPKKKRVRLFFFAVFLIIIILVFLSLYVRKTYESYLSPVSGSSSSILVTIPTGSSLPKIAGILKTSGVIKASWAFEWYVRNNNYAKSDLEAGTYILHPNQSVQQIVTQLSQGKASGNLVVILPDQRIDQIENALINDGFSKTAVTSALIPDQYVSKYPMLQGLPQNSSLEGFLYPDSFAKDNTTTPVDIVNDSLKEMQSHLTLDIVNGFNKQGLTVYQGVTLASVVEQEVSNPKDRPVVAQVFLTRLHSGMNLGSDVTAFYGAIVAGQKPSVNYDSIYNTRLHPGLPFGPISNVTESSLDAVANPSNTNYVYFVTGDNGKTYYSTTLDQHNAQVQQYCQKLCSSE